MFEAGPPYAQCGGPACRARFGPVARSVHREPDRPYRHAGEHGLQGPRVRQGPCPEPRPGRPQLPARLRHAAQGHAARLRGLRALRDVGLRRVHRQALHAQLEHVPERDLLRPHAHADDAALPGLVPGPRRAPARGGGCRVARGRPHPRAALRRRSLCDVGRARCGRARGRAHRGHQQDDARRDPPRGGTHAAHHRGARRPGARGLDARARVREVPHR